MHRRLSAERLARTRAMLASWCASASLPRHIIKVTGTSGKGSVCALLEAGLRGSGFRTGLFTSPHLIHAGERIRIDGTPLSPGEIDSLTEDLGEHLQVARTVRPGIPATFFETLLMCGLESFSRACVDVAILEVAIGGSTDIVSLVPGEVSVMTSVGIDHVVEIGPTIRDIADEKARLADQGSTLVVGPSIAGEAFEAVDRACLERSVAIRRASLDGIVAESKGLHGHRIEMHTHGKLWRVDLPLAGDHQVENFATVAGCVDVLMERGMQVSLPNFHGGIALARWPARLEVMPGSPVCIIDGAHNELAFTRLARFVRREMPAQPGVMVLGASEIDKARAACRILGPLFQSVVLTGGFYRSIEVTDTLARDLNTACGEGVKFQITSTPEAAAAEIRAARSAGAWVLVTGSLYLAGPLRELLLAE